VEDIRIGQPRHRRQRPAVVAEANDDFAVVGTGEGA